MANVPFKHTLKVGADEDVITTAGCVFGGIDVVSGTLGTVTVRSVAAGTAIAAMNISGGNFNAGPIEIMKTANGLALPGLTVQGSSAMNMVVYWRSQGSG